MAARPSSALSRVEGRDPSQGGRATASGVWTQVVGPYNEVVVEVDYPDLATYEKGVKATMTRAKSPSTS